MVNKCERLINVVKSKGSWAQARDPGQKGKVVGTRTRSFLVMGKNTTGEESEPNLSLLFKRNPVSPSHPSIEESEPQGKPMMGWVEERGESEGHPVMGWIGIKYPTRKRADFHEVFHHERTGQTATGGKADESKE